MLTLYPLNPDNHYWKQSLELYLTAFPADERREPGQLTDVAQQQGYSFNAVIHNNTFAGILETWEFGTFRFLEHIAIVPDLQGIGIGSRLISQYTNKSIKPVVLEAEPPSDPIALRRVNFYLNAGFRILDTDYTQPPYYPGKKSVPMVLLASSSLAQEEILDAIRLIREVVYGNQRTIF